jgi:hypothetical protein
MAASEARPRARGVQLLTISDQHTLMLQCLCHALYVGRSSSFFSS